MNAIGEVAVIGDVYCDVVIRGVKRMPHWGEEVYGDEPVMCPGGMANVATALAKLGVVTHLLERTHAPDTIGEILAVELAKQEGLTVHYLQEAASTALTVALPMGTERAMISYAPPASAPVRALVPWDDLKRVSHLHLGEWGDADSGLDDQVSILEEARSRGFTTSVDISWQQAPGRSARIRNLLQQVDLFLPNRSEACQIAECDDPDDALQRLAEIVPTVVIKLGADGAMGAANGSVTRLEGRTVEPVDTTGAGDAFAAGFLHSYVRRWSIDRCLALANVCGSIAVSRIGSSVSVPSRREAFTALEDYMKERSGDRIQTSA